MAERKINEPVRLGARVTTADGAGVVSDMDSTGEALVRLDSGTVLDQSHGRWSPVADMTVTGFDPDALVWWAGTMVRAGDIPQPAHTCCAGSVVHIVSATQIDTADGQHVLSMCGEDLGGYTTAARTHPVGNYLTPTSPHMERVTCAPCRAAHVR